MNFHVGAILKPSQYNSYFDWEASRRLFKAFLGVLAIGTLYFCLWIQYASASDMFIPH